MAAHNYNPAVSAEQYRLAQAVLSGTARDARMPVSVAREIVDRTPAHLRSEYSRYTENPGGVEVELTKHHHFLPFSTKKAAETMKRLLVAEGVKAEVKRVHGEWGVDHTHANPFYGTDLDLETTMAPAWVYYDSKAARDQAARLYEGRGKKVVLGHSIFGFSEGGGKKWRLRGVDHRGNPVKGPKLPIYSVSISQAKNIPSPSRGFVGLGNARKEAAKIGSKFIAQVKDSQLKHVLYMAPSSSFSLDDLNALVRLPGGGFRSHENPNNPATKGHRAVREFFGTDDIDIIFNASPERAMRELSQRTGKGHGVEHIDASEFTKKAPGLASIRGIDYVNMGDPYITTLIHDGKNFVIGKWGDWVEKYQKSQRQNPQPAADDMYASFHGEESDETIEIEGEEHYHSHLAALGELVELKVKLVVGGTAVIGFESDGGEETENPSDEVKRIKAEIRDTKKEMKERGIRRISFMNAGLTRDESNYNARLFKLKTDLERAEKGSVQNPFWPFNSFTHSTIYHVGTGEKYKKSGSYKGYTLYQKLDTGEFLVPALDKESRFDTKKDVTQFVDSWVKHQKNPKHGGPFHEAGKLLGKGTRAAQKPMDQFLGAAGKVGGYLDDELGRAINPQYMDFADRETAIKHRDDLERLGHKTSLRRAPGGGYELAYTAMPIKKNPGPSSQSTGPVYLTSNEDGTQLFIVGGDQSLDLPGLGITGPAADKELVTIGNVTNIVYHAHKIFDGKREEYDYTHKLSEDTHGPLPVLIYDRINQQLKLSGGEYKIERPLVGTSPGIEN